MTIERYELHQRWHAKTNEPMPDEIAELPLKTIKYAVEQVEAGAVVGIQKAPVVVTQDDSSMEMWDRQDEKNSNAYGG